MKIIQSAWKKSTKATWIVAERVSESEAEKKQGDIDARIRAPMYESFKVYMLNKVRAKTEVHLGKLTIGIISVHCYKVQ